MVDKFDLNHRLLTLCGLFGGVNQIATLAGEIFSDIHATDLNDKVNRIATDMKQHMQLLQHSADELKQIQDTDQIDVEYLAVVYDDSAKNWRSNLKELIVILNDSCEVSLADDNSVKIREYLSILEKVQNTQIFPLVD